ncbi:MAG: RagB/SusD family nutrient uptake outer membrane protein [Carboxylicivirga sp.]|jgi:hypothetical protein|nr:RagB/SusD family nutrient uptake outer membrane protein [Carboxylicivirga sp.]
MEEVSQDQIVPKTTSHFKEVLYKEAYRKDYGKEMEYLSLMTDELEPFRSWGSVDNINKGFSYYTWQADIETRYDGALFYDIAWDIYYSHILACNIVINTIDDIEGSETEKDDLLGEAYFLRAYAYFTLVNLYAEPFEKDKVESTLGVPINTYHGVQDKVWKRNTLKECYDLINDDITKAYELLNSSKVDKTIFRVNDAAAALLASRIFLYQKDYENTTKYANYALSLNSTLYNFNKATQPILNMNNPEILFSYGVYDSDRGLHSNMFTKRGFKVSSTLMSRYQSDDLRPGLFFHNFFGRRKALKSDNAGSTVFGKAMRVAELYLNRAEAYANSSKEDKAIEDLEFLRSYRITGDYEVELGDLTLLEYIQEERSRELCFEEHRWFDLRRTTRPEIRHSIAPTRSADEETYVLQQGDKAYTLPIPQEAMAFNTELVNNERPDRTPVTNED